MSFKGSCVKGFVPEVAEPLRGGVMDGIQLLGSATLKGLVDPTLFLSHSFEEYRFTPQCALCDCHLHSYQIYKRMRVTDHELKSPKLGGKITFSPHKLIISSFVAITRS